MMRLKTQYYRQFDADFTLEVPEEGYGGWKTGEVEIDPKRTAVLVMHAWDCGTYAQYPGWFRSCAEIPKAYAICREIFPDLLAAVRASGMPLFHVVPEAAYFKDYPGYKRAVELAGPPPPPLPACASDATCAELRRFRSDNVFVGKHNQADVSRGWANINFPKEAEPKGEEGIAKDAHQLFALCKAAGVNHLIYTGFNIDWCLLMSAGGMLDMSRRGFICSALRQAVAAVENKETARRKLAREIGLWRVSVEFGFVFDVEDFKRAIRIK